MKKIFLIILFAGLTNLAFAQAPPIFKIDSVGTEKSVKLDKFWKYKAGDNLSYAFPSFNDAAWDTLNTYIHSDSVPYQKFPGIGWFRLQVQIDSSLIDKPLAMLLNQQGASEIYIDGELIKKYGNISSDTTKEIRYNPQREPYVFQFEDSANHVIAVRYAHHTAQVNNEKYGHPIAGFKMALLEPNEAISHKLGNDISVTIIFLAFFIICLTLSLLHLLLFLFNRTQKSNLYYSIFMAGFGMVFFWLLIMQLHFNTDFITKFTFYMIIVHVTYIVALVAFLYSFYYKKLPKIFYVISAIGVVEIILTFTRTWDIGGWLVLFGIVFIETIRIVFLSIKHKRDGAWILGIGLISFILYFALYSTVGVLGIDMTFKSGSPEAMVVGLLSIFGTLSLPISMSVYLARDFAKTAKNLKTQLQQVEELSAKTLNQEQEKQQILSRQKEHLELQVAERTTELAQKNKDITDSINYAQRIQQAILPSISSVQKALPDSFIYFQPKDIVSGDFYFFAQIKDEVIIAAADCTGHGVPGAFMSMIGHDQLNHIILEKVTAPAEILTQLNKEIKRALKQHASPFEGGDVSQPRDGMDIALCSFNLKKNRLTYSAAHRSLYIIRNDELTELKPDKVAIGGLTPENYQFNSQEFKLEKGDTVYLFSDGYADQFGGESATSGKETGKKFMVKNLKKLLLNVQHLPMSDQKETLEKTFHQWKGNFEQVDDVLIIGVRI